MKIFYAAFISRRFVIAFVTGNANFKTGQRQELDFLYYLKRTRLLIQPFPFLLILLSLLSIATSAQFTKVLDFESSTTGSGPEGSFLYDGTFLYATTRYGGINNDGTIFKIKPDGTGYTRLLDFDGPTSGRVPLSSLIYDGTFLYGMTALGGSNDRGSIFKIKPDGTGYAKLLDYDPLTSGWYPEGSLFYDGTFLYGTATVGGAKGQGTLIKIKTDGTGYVALITFESAITGSNPFSSVISDGTFLYGTTRNGGLNDKGTIFKIKPDGTGYNNLLNFSGSANGAEPYGDLFYDGTFLYGTTFSGGVNNMGTLFKIKTDGTAYIKLLDFSGTATGDSPTGSLISDGAFLYGMAANGGNSNFGTIFKIKTDGTSFTKLTDFDGTNGSLPLGSLISDGVFLYGMTSGAPTFTGGTFFKYSLTITGGGGITITTQPTSISVCEGTNVTLTVAATGANNLQYQWQRNDGGTFINLINDATYSGVATASLNITKPGIALNGSVYRCLIKGDNTSDTPSNNATLSVGTSFVTAITMNGNQLKVPEGDSYQWLNFNEPIAGATNKSLDINIFEYGVYAVNVTSNGCSARSDDFIYLITKIEKKDEGLKLYPNPVEKILLVEYNPPYTIDIINSIGNQITKLKSETRTTSIDCSMLPKGIYILELKNEKGTLYNRVIKK